MADSYGVLHAGVGLTRTRCSAALEFLQRSQETDGALMWVAQGKGDLWNHVEALIALGVSQRRSATHHGTGWLLSRLNQGRAATSWWLRGQAVTSHYELHVVSYPAVLARVIETELCFAADGDLTAALWGQVDGILDEIVALQRNDGGLPWALAANGAPHWEQRLPCLSSIYLSLCSALNRKYPVDEKRANRWRECAVLLRQYIVQLSAQSYATFHRDQTTSSMDWFYPVLVGAIEGSAAERLLADYRDVFLEQEHGCRAVVNRPWVTGAETAELAMAYLRIGALDAVEVLLTSIDHLRDAQGVYWMGRDMESERIWQENRPLWTQAAVVMAFEAFNRAQSGEPQIALLADHL